MSEPPFRRLDEREVFAGQIWRVVVATYEGPDGRAFERDIVRSPGAVGVVPLAFDVEGTASVVLVRQWRPSIERQLLEIPAGMRDVEGEDPEVTAARELQEEAGLAAGRLALLTVIHPSTGVTDATTHIYLATHLAAVEASPQGPEEAHMDVVRMPLTEAVAMVRRAEITDAKTVVGLLLAADRLAAVDGGTSAP